MSLVKITFEWTTATDRRSADVHWPHVPRVGDCVHLEDHWITVDNNEQVRDVVSGEVRSVYWFGPGSVRITFVNPHVVRIPAQGGR